MITMKDENYSDIAIVIGFRRKDLDSNCGYAIFETTIEELVTAEDNTPILGAQERALSAALADVRKRIKNEKHSR